MSHFSPTIRPLFVVFSLLLISIISAVGDKEKKALTIEEAKFEMLQLYSAEKVTPKTNRVKYPELRKADKASRDAGKVYRDAAQAHPQLKARFDKIDKSKVSIPAKMKLWQPLFAEAETIKDLDKVREEYNAARRHALKVEIAAIKSEGHTELAKKMEAVFQRLKQR